MTDEFPESPDPSWLPSGRTIAFVEPYDHGGLCKVTMTDVQAVAAQRAREKTPGEIYPTDWHALDEFMLTHWAWWEAPDRPAEKPSDGYLPVEAFIKESIRPDCLPSHRFRATLASGIVKWFPTREAAVKAVVLSTMPPRRPSAAKEGGVS